MGKLDAARAAGRNRALVVMASGLGKTATAAFDARRRLDRTGRLLYLCHQNDILAQARETFEEIMGPEYSYGYLHGGGKDGLDADAMFASLQTMRGWAELFARDEFRYVVVDESHHSHAMTYRPVIEHFQPEFLLGLTATPDRTDLQDIRSIYSSEVFSLPIEKALAGRLLTDVDYRLMTDEIQNLAALDTPVGRLSIRFLNRTIFVPRRDREIVRIIMDKIAEEGITDPRIGVFCPSIDHCDRFAAAMPHAASFHSRISYDAYLDRLRRFRRGQLKALVTVDKFNEGIDVPDLNVLVFMRSTQSRTIFWQQLGRGLRLAQGKTKVLVFDFVANCERLEMVQNLWKAVRGSEGGDGGDGGVGPFTLHIGAEPFVETHKNIFEVIAGIRGGYTKEILVKQLQDLTRELGRTPTVQDVHIASAAGKTASITVFKDFFGTFNAALHAAGLPINRPTYTNAELISQLQAQARELGRTPTRGEMTAASGEGKCATGAVFAHHFGDYNRALEVAGLPLTRIAGYTKEELRKQLRTLARELGRTPRFRDVQRASSQRKSANAAVFETHFGSFTQALVSAGFKPNIGYQYSRRELTSQFKRLAKELGRRPTMRDVLAARSRSKEIAPLRVFYDVFGSFKEAGAAAGF